MKGKIMRNITEYLNTEMHTLEEKPFCKADALVLCQFSYLCIENMIDLFPGRKSRIQNLFCAEYFESITTNTTSPVKFKEFLTSAAASPRFRNITVSHIRSIFDKEKAKQFCGMCFELDKNRIFVAFRGTDASIAGWQEDFDLAFMPIVPSQKEALRYLDEISKVFHGEIMVGGHSKGGNLAEYAATYCSCKSRITKVFDLDGPGFKDDISLTPEYEEVKTKIEKYLPKSSLIGMLLEHSERHSIVECDGFWVMQHDPFMWSIAEDGDFVYAEKISEGADFFNESFCQWIYSMPPEEREKFTNTLFGLAEKCNFEKISDLAGIKDVGLLVSTFLSEDNETKKFIMELLKSFAAISLSHLKPGSKHSEELPEPEETAALPEETAQSEA